MSGHSHENGENGGSTSNMFMFAHKHICFIEGKLTAKLTVLGYVHKDTASTCAMPQTLSG